MVATNKSLNLLIPARLLSAALVLAWVSAVFPSTADARESGQYFGEGSAIVEIDGEALQVLTYRPWGCAAPSLLFVFHGNSRAVGSYLNSAKPFADRACFIIYAPLFDDDRFPNWSYHRGGLVRDGEVRPQEEWTVEMADDLVEWARRREGSNVPTYLFGHSAGGQFLARVAAYALPRGLSRIVIANSSTYVLPEETEAIPYGFGHLPEPLNVHAMIRDYLAAPITIYLGDEDTGSKMLTMTDAAVRQGENRLLRGRHVFDLASKIARDNGWIFGWTLVEAAGVGHSGRGMLGAEEMFEALRFPAR